MLELLEGAKKPDVVRLVFWLRVVTWAAVVDCVMLLVAGPAQVTLSLALLALGVTLLVAIVLLDRAIKTRGGKVNWSLRRP